SWSCLIGSRLSSDRFEPWRGGIQREIVTHGARNHKTKRSCSSSTARPDWRDKAIAASGDIDNEPIAIASVTQRAAQGRNMDREVGRPDKQVWPNPIHQLLPGDQLTRPLKQDNEDLKRATAERYRLVAFQQKKLCRKQAERSK